MAPMVEIEWSCQRRFCAVVARVMGCGPVRLSIWTPVWLITPNSRTEDGGNKQSSQQGSPTCGGRKTHNTRHQQQLIYSKGLQPELHLNYICGLSHVVSYTSLCSYVFHCFAARHFGAQHGYKSMVSAALAVVWATCVHSLFSIQRFTHHSA